MTNFIWNNKKEKIKLKTLKLSKENGGLKLVDLQKKDDSLKINFAFCLLSSPDCSHTYQQSLVEERLDYLELLVMKGYNYHLDSLLIFILFL